MAKQTKAQKETVERVMHEFKHGELEQRGGQKVRNPKQAIAIALREAGSSNQESPEENRKNLRKTKAKERKASGSNSKGNGSERTKSDLYAEAQKRDIPGRSKMSKPELERALAR